MSISIGSIKLANNVAVAPMSGVSDLPFRHAAFKAGAGLVVSEMVASEELARRRPDVVRRTENDRAVSPFVIQLAGREAKWMAKGARLAAAAGADIIDINMGCPARQVTGALSGSALMRDPDHAIDLIKATVDAADRPVTLKMRLGWDFDCLNAPEIAARAEEAGVRLVTVHGRTRNQFYNGVADWKAVKAVKDVLCVPLIVNGDICSLHDAKTALEQSGADGVMIGRAATGRPWLPGAIAKALSIGADDVSTPPLREQAALLFEQYEATLDLYGHQVGIRNARKHLAAFIDVTQELGDDAQRRLLRGQICRSTDPKEILDWLDDIGMDLDQNRTSHRAA